jgi:dsRNA-specific ribonuclease
MAIKNAEGKIVGQGTATTKKYAEQLAAKQAIEYFS